jgi:hypothetical protein
MRSYLDLSRDEVDHAKAVHKESYVVDASLVAYLDYVGEDSGSMTCFAVV